MPDNMSTVGIIMTTMFPLSPVGKWILFVSVLESGEGLQFPAVHVW